ncbi:MAG: hypothetical protein FD166_501 [Bacteroidetes bacterium]|nr:MAG: hypothetical protein FD166_501 [Bacteroidota bacterium]
MIVVFNFISKMQEPNDRMPGKAALCKNGSLEKEKKPELEIILRNRIKKKGREAITNRKGRQ